VTSSTLRADPPSNETIDVFYINIKMFEGNNWSSLLHPMGVRSRNKDKMPGYVLFEDQDNVKFTNEAELSVRAEMALRALTAFEELEEL